MKNTGRVNRGNSGAEKIDEMRMIASSRGKKMNVAITMITVNRRHFLCLRMNTKLPNIVPANHSFWKKSLRISVAIPMIIS